MASVEIQTPDGVMRARLDRDHLTIGRLSSNDISLPYPHISRQHAELRLMGQTWWVVDLRSTNGLHVSGQRVSESRLTPGAVVMLSPLISLSLLDESAAQPSYPQQQAYSPPYASPSPAPAQGPVHAATPTPAYPSYSAYPATPAPAPASTPIAPPAREPIAPLSALGPRSPYADDEAPFYPQMRQAEYPRFAPPTPSASAIPPSRPPRYASAPSFAPAEQGDVFDPHRVEPMRQVRQAGQSFEQRRTAHVAPSSLLHVCQTCGQRTMPDAVYCQNCHHSIASECVRCRLSLLPIQDLCPRCQTPNPYSVRRVRHTAGPS